MSRTTASARWQAGPAWQDHDLVTCTGLDTPMDAAHVRQSWYGLRHQLELDALRTYDLRHTCGSLLLAASVNSKVVQACLGHAGIAHYAGALLPYHARAARAGYRSAGGRLVSETDRQQNGSNEPAPAAGES